MARHLTWRQQPVHYAWIVAAVGFLVLIGASAIRSAPGVLITSLQEEFGWSRATVSFAISINLLLFGIIGPFAAALMERYGIRKVVSGALALMAVGALSTLLMTEPWHLYLSWGFIVGLSTGSIVSVLAASVSQRWFVQRRGLVVGGLTAAGATGQLAFLPLLAWLATRFGWQAVSITAAASALIVLPVAAILLRNMPSDLGLTPFGASPDYVLERSTVNPIQRAFGGLRVAVASRDFWLLAGTFFICGATTNGLVGTHLIPAGVDHGMTEVAAANLLALIGVFDIIGTMASGWLTDRYDSRRLLFAYYALRGSSLMILPWAFDSSNFTLIAFVVFYGLDWVATVPPTVNLASKTFGPMLGTVIYGWIFSAHQLGAASAAYIAGVVRTEHGDYFLAFTGAGWLSLLAALLATRIGRGSRRTRMQRGTPLVPVPDAAASAD
jgi:predicted MFS family arabinose efflux permease